MNDRVYIPVNKDSWLPAGLALETDQPVLVTPQLALPGPEPIHEIFLFEAAEIVIPEIDGVSVVLPGTVGGSPLEVFLSEDGIGRLSAPLVLRVRSDILRPLKPGTDEIDEAAEFLDIALGSVTLVFPADGGITLEGATGVSVPRCMIGRTGLVIEAAGLRFVTADDADPFVLAPGAPGIALEGVTLELPGALPGIALSMENVFIGAGGFWGQVSFEDRNLAWSGNDFQGTVTGDLLGFPGGLHRVGIELRQSALVGARIEGDVFLPFLDLPVGVTLGLDGNGGFTASAGPAHSPGGAQASDAFLFEAGVGDFLNIGINSLTFTTRPVATVTLGGDFAIDIPLLDAPPVTVEGLSITADGKVSVEGGWIDLRKALAGSFGGFPLELTRFGLGSEEGSPRRWLGLNGAIRMASGLPAGASVEGLRLSWDPEAADVASSLRVSLDGIGLELAVPGAFTFAGSVAFFEDGAATGFRGHGKLDLVALGMEVDAGIVVGRTASGDTFFFFHLDIELPTGIPLFTTGAALYGLSGLVADDMAPDRSANEDWYWDWYQRPSKGATDPGKWAVESGAFAIGLGATVGTAFDDGFTFNTRCLLVLVLPGPRILLSGSGNFLSSRKADAEGAFDALLVLDTPGKLFQANLTAQYEIPVLISARGGIDVGFSWASPPPPDLWHVNLGRYEPRERRIGATWLKVLKAEAWLMVSRSGLDLGGWAGIDETFGFPPAVTVTIDIGIDGRGRVAWDPLHFMGELNLGGTVGVRAFGVGATLTAMATIEAQAPSPFWLQIKLLAELEVDLFLVSFDFSHTVVLEWGDPNQPLPVPSPPIERIAFEHERARVNLPHSSGAPVPPDVRPVVVFKRPVGDPSGIAEPAVPVPVEKVGKFRFFHELGHVCLRGGDGALFSAAGFARLDGDQVLIEGGLSLDGVAGGSIDLAGTGRFAVDAVAGGVLTLGADTGAALERVAYRLRAAVNTQPVTITVVGQKNFGTRQIELQAPINATPGAQGGLLQTGDDETWRIMHAEGRELVVRERTDGRDPVPGAAQILEREAPMVAGSWLAGTDGDLGGTRLMLWASNPFAWFRSNDGRTRDLLEAGNEACGPVPEQHLACIDLVPEMARGKKDALVMLNVQGDAEFVRRDMRMAVHLGPRPGATGTLLFHFDPPVDRVEIRAAYPEHFQASHAPSGMAIARLKGTQTGTIALGDGLFTLAGALDELEVSGVNLLIEAICYAPDWACLDLAEDVADGQALPLDIEPHGLTLSSAARHARDLNFRSFRARGDNPLAPFLRGRRFGRRGRRIRPFPPGRHFGPQPPPIDIGDLLRRKASAAIDFEQPVTRLRVTLGSEAEVMGFAEGDQVAVVAGNAGETVQLSSEHFYFDRIVISGRSPLLVGQLCWDTGDLGRQREGRAAWRRSLENAIERFSDESPVLDPGRYQVEVATLTTTIAEDGGEAETWSTARQPFEVGPPPGLGSGGSDGYPDGGPLAGLDSYVKRSLPGAGLEPVYRKDDVKVDFAEDYVSRMYLAVNKPLSLRVTDARGRVSRRAAHNAWGGTRRQLRVDEETWMLSLHTGGRCASIDLDRVAQDESLAGAGSWLSAASLQAAELRAGNRTLYTLEFVTSSYGSFQHQLAHARRGVRDIADGGADAGLATALADLRQARDDTLQLQTDLQSLLNRSGNSPDRQDLDQQKALESRLQAAVEVAAAAEAEVFDRIASRHGIRKTAGLPQQPECSRLPGMLLVESPEPLHAHRLRARLLASDRPPLRRRPIEFIRRSFGDPDTGRFPYAGLNFDTSQELRCRGGALSPVTTGDWTLKVRGPALHGLAITVVIEPGGEVRLDGQGEGVGPQQISPAGHEGELELVLTADRLAEASMVGNRFILKAMSVMESAVMANPASALRIEEIACPSADGSDDHFVALVALRDVDLEGYTLMWDDATWPTGSRRYHEFAPESLQEGDRIVVQGGRATAVAVQDSRVRVGGTDGALPRAGVSVELIGPDRVTVDFSGRLADEAYTEAQDLSLVANPDQTRLLLVDGLVNSQQKHYALEVRYSRDAGRPWPVQTVNGSRRGERICWTLSA